MVNPDSETDSTRGGGFQPPPPRVEPSPRWVRAEINDRVVADSRRTMLHAAFGPSLVPDSPAPLLPGYFFPTDDVAHAVLHESDERDGRRFWDVTVRGTTTSDAAWAYTEPTGPVAALADHLTFRWEAMDAWYEEAEQVFVHARDPRKRVDVLASSRTVEVALDGRVLAHSEEPFVLFETDLPTRYYLPPDDVDWDLLEPTDTTSACPYKGTARYWSVRDAGEAGRDVAWSYPDPVREQPLLADLVCFSNEKVDLVVDGDRLERPQTPWS